MSEPPWKLKPEIAKAVGIEQDPPPLEMTADEFEEWFQGKWAVGETVWQRLDAEGKRHE